ncbi:hypothetical protein [Prosthecobacter vanneervenii]|uniref:Uncharacterized protein n=1 Tax=Prosthecobacter vanneervenii TaxID=48466 RepID=A0A7W7YCQ5_9BACT|nr:hypothetical protein [Prosthecobacter vanneervenii]MBB5033465.1 hypothetical protein [Prosthecobacter vanneervenii]
MHRSSSLLLLLAIITLAHGAEPAKDKASPQSPATAQSPLELAAIARLKQKMNEIIIPSVHFENATLEQALEFLRKKSRQLDKSSAPTGTKGIKLILRQPAPQEEIRITLDLKDVPFSEALLYVTELGQMVYRVDAEGVILSDRHAYESERHTRTFRVPPDFFSVEDYDPSNVPTDPFATTALAPNTPAGKIPRKTPQQILEAAGITFPEGSSVSFNPLTGLLRVTNNQPNLDLVEALCESILYHPPKIIALTLTIIEGPGDLVRQINTDASKSADAGRQLTSLLDLAHKPGSSVRVAGHAFIETKSGYPVTTEAVSEPWLSNRAPIDLSSRISETADQQPTGLCLNLEPSIQADGQTIDLKLDLELRQFASSATDAPHSDGTTPATDIPSHHLTSSLMIRDGTTKLIGIARPPGLQQKANDTLWAAFITTAIRYVENPPHHLALGIPSTSTPPKGLSSITFQIPEGLFESIMEPAPKSLKDWLIDQGVTFPSGSVIELKNDLLQITNTQENIDTISTLIAAAVHKAPKNVAVRLHTVRLPSSYLPKLSQAALNSTDQTAEWKEVESAAARGEAVFLESAFFETKSGTRSSHVAAKECYFLAQTPPKDKSPPAISLKNQTLGSSLELEPTLGADGRTIEVDYNHDLHVTAADSIRALKTRSHTTMHEGEIRLIALHQDLCSSHADHIWATFLQCNVVPHFPRPKHPLKVTALASANPDALETKTYYPPPEILFELHKLNSPSPFPAMGADPFGTNDSPAPQEVPQSPKSPQDVLKKLGFTFPKGSLSHFDATTSTLTVRNTPANHALIAAAIEKHILALPSTVAITTHVLQGPGPLLRSLASQASHKSDHRTEFDELLTAAKAGTVLHLDTARLESKPGTRAITNQGHEHKAICEITLDEKGQPVLKQEPRPVGCNVELEATVSKDSPFVDLIISAEYHTAPPLEHREHLIAPQGHRLDFPLTDFFTSKTVTGITIPSGTARLLSLYRPTGKPEFEKQDILQAIFITCDILRLNDPPAAAVK